MKKTFYTTYATAVNWLKNNYVLCNDIVKIDEFLFDNARFNLCDENDDFIEIFQYFITDANLSDVEYLEKHFGLKFSFSEKLDCFILCVDHYGTSWDYVPCEVLTYNNEDGFYPHIESYEELTGQKF